MNLSLFIGDAVHNDDEIRVFIMDDRTVRLDCDDISWKLTEKNAKAFADFVLSSFSSSAGSGSYGFFRLGEEGYEIRRRKSSILMTPGMASHMAKYLEASL